MIKLRSCLFFLSLAILFFSCKKSASNNQKGNLLVKVKVNIELPTGVLLTNSVKYKVTNSNGEFEVPIISTVGGRINGKQYVCEADILPNSALQLHYMINSLGATIMYSTAYLPSLESASTYSGININGESTALATLMMHPLLITSYREVYEGITSDLKQMPSYSIYLSQVEQKIVEGIQNKINYCFDYSSLAGYRTVIVEYVNSVKNENYQLMKSKLEMIPTSGSQSKIGFKIINQGKRSVNIYANKVYLDVNGNPFNTQPINITELGEESSKKVILMADAINYWSFVKESFLGALSGNIPEAVYKSETKEILTDIGDAQRLKVEIWGLGRLHKPKNQFSIEEWRRLIEAIIGSSYKDFVNPTIALTAGIKMEVRDIGTGKFDFRYGSRKHSFSLVISQLTDAYLSRPELKEVLVDKLLEEDYTAILQDMIYFILKEITSDFNQDPRQAKYLNLIYNLYKDVANVSQTSDEFRSNFKLAANSFWHFADLASKTIKISEASVDLAFAIKDAFGSKTMETFTMNRDGSLVYDITTGLIAYYPFNENANDNSGNSNNGTIVAGVAPTADRKNNPNGAMLFNGYDGYISIPPSASLNSLNKDGDATFACWFKTDSWNNIGGHISKNDNGNGMHYRFLLNETTTLLQVEQPFYYSTYQPLETNKWYFFVAVKSGGIAKVYINGVLISSGALAGDQWETKINTSLEIGRDAHGPIEYTRGAFDDIRIYNRALSENEIKALYSE